MRVPLAVLLLALACGGRMAGPSANISPADAGVDPQPSDAGSDPPPPSDAGTPSTPSKVEAPPAGSLYHGVIAPGPGSPDSDVSEAAVDAYEQTVGRKVAYVYFDDEWMNGRAFPKATAGWIRDRGAVPFIRLMLRTHKGVLAPDPAFSLDQINAGDVDKDLAAWALQARDFGTPLIVEYGTEINGDWNPWSAPYNGGLDVAPAKFQHAYRHIVQVMRGAGANNITWALHYAGQSFPDDPRNVPKRYYPGDDVVDWVGISAYGAERSNDSRDNTFRSLVDDMVPKMRAATAVKPLFIFEFGDTLDNPINPAPQWVSDAFSDLLGGRWPDIRGFCWWNQAWDDPSFGGSTDMLVQDSPAVTAAFRSAVQSKAVVDQAILQ